MSQGRPKLLLMFAAMFLILGVMLKLVGYRTTPEEAAIRELASDLENRLTAISQGGDSVASKAYEQAVNRFTFPENELKVPFEQAQDEFIKINELTIPLLDKATQADRINFRRNWSKGFEVSPIGVIDIRNMALLNYARMNGENQSKEELTRLASSIRTLAGYLEFDPMIRSLGVYAPSMHIYLFALEKNVNRGVYTPEQLTQIIELLERDESKYADIFRKAIKNEHNLLLAYPATLNNIGKLRFPSDSWQEQSDFAANELLKYSGFLVEDFYINKKQLESMPSYENSIIARRLVPDIQLALMLSRLRNHNRLARLALTSELEMMTGKGVNFSATLIDALTGEELILTSTPPKVTASTKEPQHPEEIFSILHFVK